MGVEKKMSRVRFLQLGGAGIVGIGLSGFAHPAYAQATGIGDPKNYGAVGDGVTDDGPAFRACMEDPANIGMRLSAAPGPGYAIYMGQGWRPLPLKTGFKIYGAGAQSLLIRRGDILRRSDMFRNLASNPGFNADGTRRPAAGNDGIELHDLFVDGRKYEWANQFNGGKADIFNDLVKFITINSRLSEGRSSGFIMRNCRVEDWLGPACILCNIASFDVSNNTVLRPHRGGLIFNWSCLTGSIKNNTVLHSGDDAIGFNADSPNNNDQTGVTEADFAPSRDVTVQFNELSGKREPDIPVEAGTIFETNSPLAVRGGADIRLFDNTVNHSYDPDFDRTVHSPKGTRQPGCDVKPFDTEQCRDINIRNLRVLQSGGHALDVLGTSTTGRLADSIARNNGLNPAWNLVPGAANFPAGNNSPAAR